LISMKSTRGWRWASIDLPSKDTCSRNIAPNVPYHKVLSRPFIILWIVQTPLFRVCLAYTTPNCYNHESGYRRLNQDVQILNPWHGTYRWHVATSHRRCWRCHLYPTYWSVHLQLHNIRLPVSQLHDDTPHLGARLGNFRSNDDLFMENCPWIGNVTALGWASTGTAQEPVHI
jgi:hypothetical protein